MSRQRSSTRASSLGRGTEGARLRESACRRLRAAAVSPSRSVRDVVRETQTARNVIAYLPATSPLTASRSRGSPSARTTIISAGASTATRSPRAPRVGRAHLGADDNASGTAAVLAIAEALSPQPAPPNLLVAFWSAEEVGLVGSSAFTAAPPVPLDRHRRIPELRHGRAHAGQQADHSGGWHEPSSGDRFSNAPTRLRAST